MKEGKIRIAKMEIFYGSLIVVQVLMVGVHVY
jgi:hypothetical protein